MSRPACPRGLQAAGKALWRSLLDDLDEGLELSAKELALLGLAAKQAHTVAELERVLAGQGYMMEGSRGQPRLSSVVTELRQGRLALARILADWTSAISTTTRVRRPARVALVGWPALGSAGPS